MNAEVLGVRAKERADGGDLVAEGQGCWKGRKGLHDVQIEVRDEKEMYLFQRASSVALCPDMEQPASDAYAPVEERAV
jgi:hypothetical protein